MENKGHRVIKVIMIVVNVIVLICGLALLGLGIWVYANAESFRNLISSNPVIFNSVAVFIVIGGVLIVSGFFGCAGVVKENKCLLGTYFATIFLIFIVEIVAAILVFVYYPTARETALLSIQTNVTEEELVYWDIIQTTFQCCGFNNASDWASALPDSCCQTWNTTCTPERAFEPGCEEEVKQYFWVLGGVGIAVLAFEVLAMSFTCCLYRGIVGSYQLA